jgi:hypothetical protein
MSILKSPSAPIEYLTPDEAAAILRVSPDTITRKFENRKGVLDLGSPETCHKRRRRVLRIPREVFDQYVHEIRVRA